jgi:hypothetical protein
MHSDASHPFSYDFGLKKINCTSASEVTVCCHGYGDSNAFVDTVKSFGTFDHTLIGFNFPDHHITDDTDHRKISYGTINEILPLIYALKECVENYNFSKINLYGFSAGGGAIINALSILNTYSHPEDLKKIGVTQETAKIILDRVQKGMVILECPLKSVREIIALRGSTANLELMAQNYDKNSMNPLDAIQLLNNLKLTLLLYWEKPDEVVGNRDDDKFVNNLRKISQSTVHVVTGSDGGHCGYHKKLWQEYKKLKH